MALCSQAFNNASKRSCAFGVPEKQVKRTCFDKEIGRSAAAAAIYSSSEDNVSSDDEQSCYNADQVRAKRRASTRISFSLNSELSRAISKYSDDDESNSDGENVDNIDCKLSSLPSINKRLMHISDLSTASNGKKIIPDADKDSRSRCFEYLVGAIDEAWARYCNATSSVEDEVYGYDTPLSVATDDEDYFGNTTDITEYEDSEFEYSNKNSISSRSQTRPACVKRMSMMDSTAVAMANAENPSKLSVLTSKDSSSSQLQALKDRLTKAKYYLQDLVDSEDYNDASAFWKRWDMIKYATIELVEDDDDDELVESTIEELEDGRLFVN